MEVSLFVPFGTWHGGGGSIDTLGCCGSRALVGVPGGRGGSHRPLAIPSGASATRSGHEMRCDMMQQFGTFGRGGKRLMGGPTAALCVA